MNGLWLEAQTSSSQQVGDHRQRRFWWAALFAVLWAVTCAFAPTHQAQAAENIYTRIIPLTATDFNDTITLPKFNSQLGALERVEISFSSKLKGSVRFESLDASVTLITTQLDGQLQLQGPDGAVLASANPTTTRSIKLSAFDGAFDFDGPSGGAFKQLVAVDLSDTKVLLDPTELAIFSGPGSLQMMMATQADVTGSGGGNLALDYATQASAQVTVKYVYRTTINPMIDLKKYTNGEDADLPTGPLVEEGKPVVWTYVVQNTGDTPLVNVQLVDDQEGVITCPKGALALSEQMTCTAQGIASLGQYTNTATVTGETPKDPLVPTQTVSDTDPSHYYGVPIANLCPVDSNDALVLPTVTYLGEGGGPYTLPAGYDTFVVKRLTPFRFVVEPGVDVSGQKVYTLLNANERVWACAGACQFPKALHSAFSIGQLGQGITIGAVVLDDDNDGRINAWVGVGANSTYSQTINNQMMVENLVLDVPFDGDWSFDAVDSVGLLHICLAPTTGVRSASIWGEGIADPQPEELNEGALSHIVFLPIMRNE